ncbi:phage protease [uncultured Thiodictyon sp.]|uniref:phage protease n=1 Tax=uncultured Thiodictyon sp. TaxID=1846217 RepID=UPI002600416B|nr:phage protease [uncultured Thiodictyon sp.]
MPNAPHPSSKRAQPAVFADRGPAAGVPAAGYLSCQGAGVALAALPTDWCELIPPGECLTRDGRGPYTLAAAAAVVAAFAIDFPPGSDQAAPVDYDHADLKRTPGADLPPAAGWLAELRLSGNGGIEGRIEWTERARAHIAAREYRYLSPELLVDPESNAIVGLSGAGLTHRPNLYLRALSHRALPPHLEPQMDADELLERLRYLFNLPTLATTAEIGAQLQILTERLKAEGEPAAAAGLVSASATPADRIVLMTQMGRGLSGLRELCAVAPEVETHQVLMAAHARITDLTNTLAERDATETVAQALRERLIEPAKRDWAQGYAKRDPQGFRDYLKGCTPILLSRTDQTPGTDPAGSDYESLVTATMASDKVSRGTAMMAIARAHPEAHRAWIESTQPQTQRA